MASAIPVLDQVGMSDFVRKFLCEEMTVENIEAVHGAIVRRGLGAY